MRLAELGWDETRASEFAAWAEQPGTEPARVAIEFNHIFRVLGEGDDLEVTTSGRLKHHVGRRSELPAVGDWVVVRRRPGGTSGDIIAVLPRRSWFSRKTAGHVTDEQVVAANVDVVFVVMGLDGDYNLRRLERYLLLARESGAKPVVLLTKSDVADALDAVLAEVARVAPGIPVHAISPRFATHLADVQQYIRPGVTAALLGSSGVGKSTIINRLAGDALQRTREVRASDSRGRHTTTHRELVVLPDGGLIIDTPGMRELQLWDVGEAVKETFDEIEHLSANCRFSDCRHRDEPRCAVKEAVDAGQLSADRLESYHKLQEELEVLARRQDARALIDEKRRSKVMHKALKSHLKTKRG